MKLNKTPEQIKQAIIAVDGTYSPKLIAERIYIETGITVRPSDISTTINRNKDYLYVTDYLRDTYKLEEI